MNTIYTNLWRVTFSLSLLITFCGSENHLSISQLSPKSTESYEDDSQIIQGTLLSSISKSNDDLTLLNDNEKFEKLIRIERSASPILNDLPSKSNVDELNNEKAINSNEFNGGRYLNYNIKPTATLNRLLQKVDITKSQQRFAKNLERSNFLLNGGLRQLMSGSPIIKTSNVMPTSGIVMASSHPNIVATIPDNKPRQNPSPDIQDIITGIVKLLNGNVNVHANTQQALRRPSASRINNRGPPRISEAQPLPNDYDIQKPPFPFERPMDNPNRPFMNVHPISEQINPLTNNNNYRPTGFISQNRPPWHRPRPRPPITGNRRPIPPYKPMLQMEEQHIDDTNVQYTTIESDNNNESPDNSNNGVAPTDNKYDNDLVDVIENDVIASSTESSLLTIPTTMEVPIKKDEYTKKKDTNIKNKLSEKKPIVPITPTLTSTENIMTTIIESTSVVNTVQVLNSMTSMPITEEDEENNSSLSLEDLINDDDDDDIHFITTRTPILESSISSSDSTSSSSSSTSLEPVIATEIQSTFATTTEDLYKKTTTGSPIITSNTESYHPRPGIVLDDPEFKPGGGIARPTNRPPLKPQQIQPTRQQLPPGYGEIFDVTLSAIQGPGNGGGVGGSKQTINIKPYGTYNTGNGNGSGDIILAPEGDDGFVSIDGKRTYINLFGEPTDGPANAVGDSTIPEHPSHNIHSSHNDHQQSQSVLATGYAIPQSDQPLELKPTKIPTPSNQRPSSVQPVVNQQRPHYRPRTTQPPVRIDTCIVGDDSTCDQAQNEKCKTENGVSSCHCRPGYARRKHREPCRRVVSFFMSLRVDKIYERRIVWDNKLLDKNSEHYGQLSYESIRALDSAMSMTPFSDEFMDAKVNNIYHGDPSQGAAGVFVNLTLKLEENAATLRSNLRGDVQKHLLGVIHRRNNNIGNSVLYVESPAGSISNLQDLDECQTRELNDCHVHANCTNIWGSFRCECDKGFRDPWSDQPQRAGKECQSCPDSHCNNRGSCSYDKDGVQVCICEGNFYGSQCEIDGEVLGVAIGASVAAVIIIVLTLICLIMWSRRWQREQKNAMGSPVFGYMNTGTVVKAAGMGGHPAYQVTLEDRMRWAQIADVMAQANHYGAEPVATVTRPSSAMFGYPNLQAMGMGMGGMSRHGTMQMHQQTSTMPPVPLPRRLAISHHSSNGMRTLENSSSSEEEDRTDLIGRNFHVPRPKSRSNGSIANQSGIYYDVDYEPSGCDLYGGTTTTSISTSQIPGPQGIPMSTYTSGRAPSTYYMK